MNKLFLNLDTHHGAQEWFPKIHQMSTFSIICYHWQYQIFAPTFPQIHPWSLWVSVIFFLKFGHTYFTIGANTVNSGH